MIVGVTMVYVDSTVELSGEEGAVCVFHSTSVDSFTAPELKSSRESRVGGPVDGQCMVME